MLTVDTTELLLISKSLKTNNTTAVTVQMILFIRFSIVSTSFPHNNFHPLQT